MVTRARSEGSARIQNKQQAAFSKRVSLPKRTKRKAGAREKTLLRFIAEQSTVTISQLSTYSGLSIPDTKHLVNEFEKERWVEAKQIFTGDNDKWVWLRGPGFHILGISKPRVLEPNYRRLAHIGAITDARLWLEKHFNVCSWLPESRSANRPRGWRGKVPDAAANVVMEDADGVKKNYLIAIEAQLSYSGGPRLEQKLANYPLKYQGIIYFAVPKVCRLFERLNLVKKYPKVAVQEIAEVSRSLQQPAWRVPGDPALGLRYSPKRLDSPLSEFDLAVLDLLADQGAVPMDQFFRFLGMDEAKEKDKEKVERLVSRLVHAHLVRRAKPLVDEPIWLWLTRTGGIMSRRNLSPRAPSLGNLEFARALNEARLQLTKDLSDDGWVSGRVLRHEHGVRGSLPHAVIQRGPKRIAIEVVLSAGAYGLQRKWKQRRQEYQEILWYYSRLARTPVKRFAAMTKSSRLQVSPLPNAGDMDFASRPKWSRRFYGINKELWYWLTRRPPVTVWPIPVEELPLEVPQVIGAAAKIAQTPQVIAGWRSLGTIWAVFCVETDVGTYRVAKSSHGWDAVELVDGSKPIDDLIFRKESISLSAALATAQEKQDTCKHYEVDDDLWVKVKPLMPPSYTSSRRASDRAVLSAVLFILRSNIGRSRLPQELGYGSGQSVISRWRKWQEHEGWEDVMRVLIEGLPDGAELDWSRLDRKGSPSKS